MTVDDLVKIASNNLFPMWLCVYLIVNMTKAHTSLLASIEELKQLIRDTHKPGSSA